MDQVAQRVESEERLRAERGPLSPEEQAHADAWAEAWNKAREGEALNLSQLAGEASQLPKDAPEK